MLTDFLKTFQLAVAEGNEYMSLFLHALQFLNVGLNANK
jgi:hypothetical protein